MDDEENDENQQNEGVQQDAVDKESAEEVDHPIIIDS